MREPIELCTTYVTVRKDSNNQEKIGCSKRITKRREQASV